MEPKAKGSVMVSKKLSSDLCLWIFGGFDISYADERELRSVFSPHHRMFLQMSWFRRLVSYKVILLE